MLSRPHLIFAWLFLDVTNRRAPPTPSHSLNQVSAHHDGYGRPPFYSIKCGEVTAVIKGGSRSFRERCVGLCTLSTTLHIYLTSVHKRVPFYTPTSILQHIFNMSRCLPAGVAIQSSCVCMTFGAEKISHAPEFSWNLGLGPD